MKIIPLEIVPITIELNALNNQAFPQDAEGRGQLLGKRRAYIFIIECFEIEDTFEEAIEAIEEYIWKTKCNYCNTTTNYSESLIKEMHTLLLSFLTKMNYQWNTTYKVFSTRDHWVDPDLLHEDIASLSFDEHASQCIPGEQIYLFKNTVLEPIQSYPDTIKSTKGE